MIKEILEQLFEHQTLNREEAKAALAEIANGKCNNSEIAAFISVYLMRSIKVEELAGFRDALLELCTPVDLSDFNTIDLCGTGGDKKNTFNISTLSSFVVAGTGGKVAKHGNYGVSSNCGSSNVMEALGYKFKNDVPKLREEMEKTGICFLHAPLFNSAMKNVAPIRRELGVKTFFNMLGPMINPSFPKNQMVGVYSLEISRLYNYIYQQTKTNFIILYSLDGYDEISLTSDFKITSRELEQVMNPAMLGLKSLKPEELYGGKTVEDATKIFMDVLNNQGTEAQKQAVIANSTMALKCLSPSKSFEDCVGEAKESLESGKALSTLNKLISLQ